MKELSYRREGAYLVPNLMPDEQTAEAIGRYGLMRRTHLENNRPLIYDQMMTEGTLYAHLAQIDKRAEERLELMMRRGKARMNLSEELKDKDPMAWVGLMNNLKAQAEEVILEDLIYS
ncbi:MAG: TnpV protein [Clostridiales bacterium]|nr:TnpV protein [Clostridiales bacterium]